MSTGVSANATLNLTDDGYFASPTHRSVIRDCMRKNDKRRFDPPLLSRSSRRDEARKPISRDVYIDLSASFRSVYLFVFFSFLLYCYTSIRMLRTI